MSYSNRDKFNDLTFKKCGKCRGSLDWDDSMDDIICQNDHCEQSYTPEECWVCGKDFLSANGKYDECDECAEKELDHDSAERIRIRRVEDRVFIDTEHHTVDITKVHKYNERCDRYQCLHCDMYVDRLYLYHSSRAGVKLGCVRCGAVKCNGREVLGYLLGE